ILPCNTSDRRSRFQSLLHDPSPLLSTATPTRSYRQSIYQLISYHPNIIMAEDCYVYTVNTGRLLYTRKRLITKSVPEPT
ncbi:MAG: hypothetical protein ABI119_13040, partial [Gemmatimonadaceae bacterium]